MFRTLFFFFAKFTGFKLAGLAIVYKFHLMVGTLVIQKRVDFFGFIILRLWFRLVNDVFGFIINFESKFKGLLHIYNLISKSL
jgi:hypothetical protein